MLPPSGSAPRSINLKVRYLRKGTNSSSNASAPAASSVREIHCGLPQMHSVHRCWISLRWVSRPVKRLHVLATRKCQDGKNTSQGSLLERVVCGKPVDGTDESSAAAVPGFERPAPGNYHLSIHRRAVQGLQDSTRRNWCPQLPLHLSTACQLPETSSIKNRAGCTLNSNVRFGRRDAKHQTVWLGVPAAVRSPFFFHKGCHNQWHQLLSRQD